VEAATSEPSATKNMHVAELAVVIQGSSHSIRWRSRLTVGAILSQYHCDGYVSNPCTMWYRIMEVLQVTLETLFKMMR